MVISLFRLPHDKLWLKGASVAMEVDFWQVKVIR
jgi:hypothetical protein